MRRTSRERKHKGRSRAGEPTREPARQAGASTLHHALSGARATSGKPSIARDQVYVHTVHCTVTRDVLITSSDAARWLHRRQSNGRVRMATSRVCDIAAPKRKAQ